MSEIGRISIDHDFIPRSAEDWAVCLADPMWRICSGQLYKIMVKGDDDLEGHVLPFRPNRAQRKLLRHLHNRNVILKARQLGFTTLVAIVWLDHALFVPDQRCGIIAHSLDDAAVIFRDKVKFAYLNLPVQIRERFPLARDSAKELVFGHNNSAIRVATSMRSGTIHRLHISEMGKIASKYPEKAVEIVTGSLPAVPLTGVAIIESTAEGQDGEFYNIATKAEALAQEGRYPTPQEWMFHFFPWWEDPGYQVDPSGVRITAEQHAYFDAVQVEMECIISLRQRAWYVQKLENDFSGDAEKMWREMPSTPEECWRKSAEGTFYAPQIARTRIEGRLCNLPHVDNVLVHTFWDIGSGDGTAIWCMQHVGGQHRFIRFIEDWGQGYARFIRELRETGWLFGIHYLPHDANHKRQLANTIAAPLDMLSELAPDWRFDIVPKVNDIQHGIELTRQKFSQAYFNRADEGVMAGFQHLSLYHKKWNARLGVWSHEPEKLSGHSEAADAFRQWAQGFDPQAISGPTRPRRRASGAMTT